MLFLMGKVPNARGIFKFWKERVKMEQIRVVLALFSLILLAGCTQEAPAQEELAEEVVVEPQEQMGTPASGPASAEPDGNIDCPYGFIDDSYPGQCGRYVDANEDGICDHSQ